METKNTENNIENVYRTEQGCSSESDDVNHNDNDNGKNTVNNYRARLRPRPMMLPDDIYSLSECTVLYVYAFVCMHVLLYIIAALHTMLYNIKYFLYGFIDIYRQQNSKKKKKETLKMGGILDIVRAILASGRLPCIICCYHVIRKFEKRSN